MTRLRHAHGRRRGPRPRASTRVITVAAVVCFSGSLALTHVQPGWSAWQDEVPVTGTTLGTHRVQPLGAVLCTPGLGSLTYSWTGVDDPRYDYQVQVVPAGKNTTRTITAPDRGASYGVTYAAADLPGGDFAVQVTPFLEATSWTSSTAASSAGTKTTLGLLSVLTAC